MSKQIIEIKIELEGLKPKVWRSFQVEADITFNRLHEIIQKVMGWENYHMYDFKVGTTSIVDHRSEEGEYGFGTGKTYKANKVKLADFIEKKSQKFNYFYDMVDFWEHKLTVKKIFDVDDDDKAYPIVLAGERACPPEDCGGVWGYMELLEILSDPEHPEYEERIEDWLGEDFDPEYFNVEEVNKKFRKTRIAKTKNKKPVKPRGMWVYVGDKKKSRGFRCFLT